VAGRPLSSGAESMGGQGVGAVGLNVSRPRVCDGAGLRAGSQDGHRRVAFPRVTDGKSSKIGALTSEELRESACGSSVEPYRMYVAGQIEEVQGSIACYFSCRSCAD